MHPSWYRAVEAQRSTRALRSKARWSRTRVTLGCSWWVMPTRFRKRPLGLDGEESTLGCCARESGGDHPDAAAAPVAGCVDDGAWQALPPDSATADTAQERQA